MKQLKPKYTAEKCECCNQTKTYVFTVDRGTADILKAFALAVQNKGVNLIHPRNDLEIATRTTSVYEANRLGMLTSTQIANLSRLCFHGLIASKEN